MDPIFWAIWITASICASLWGTTYCGPEHNRRMVFWWNNPDFNWARKLTGWLILIILLGVVSYLARALMGLFATPPMLVW